MSRRSEKVMVLTTGEFWLSDNEKQVDVIIEATGERITLPEKEVELFGKRLYMPKWLSDKFGIDNVPF
jgi:hypothetical protein